MTRRARLLAGIALCAAVGTAFGALRWWVVQWLPPLAGIEPDSVRAVEVEFGPWGEEPAPAGGASNDRDVVAAVLAVLRTGTEHKNHKYGDRGALLLQRTSGATVRLGILPGHSADWYELRCLGKLYRVPRAAFVEAMRRVGVAVPLKC